MKYIVLQKEDGGLMRGYPIIFPESLTHSIVAWALCGSIELHGAKPIAAGSINSADLEPRCYGLSNSLSLKSRRKIDDDLIAMNDYMHGI